MDMRAAVITVSDKATRGERVDTSGPALCEMLADEGWEIVYTSIVPDDEFLIKNELIKCADELKIPLVLTTGGTGFSPRDVTPEATLAVIQRRTPGIPEAMRAESLKITPRGCLSREEAGIRGGTLIINLPGSRKASTENFAAVIQAVHHGVEMLQSSGSANCGSEDNTLSALRATSPKGEARTRPPFRGDVANGDRGVIIAVNISTEKGTQKTPVEKIEMRPEYGITGDAHAGNWHRQVSLLGVESVRKVQGKTELKLSAGAFAENILTEGICLYELPVGTRLKIGTALCEVTQIGKECHTACEIRRLTGDCVMPREGIFVKVLEAGEAKAGDRVIVI